MPTINELPLVTQLTTSDQLPLYSQANGDARRATIATLVTFLSSDAFASFEATSYISTTPVTVANLPSATTSGSGARAMVTNANATTFGSIVAGGGANIIPVFSDGTDWRIG
jgi:hypothetical protein